MAKQTLYPIWEKTFGIVSFYKRCGVGCVRMKSNLTAERWRSDPAFEGSRNSAACMALAPKLASTFYQTIPKQQHSYPFFRKLVGIAQHMLCKEYNIQQVNQELHFAVSRYLRKLHAADPNRKPLRSPFAVTLSLKAKPAFNAAPPHQLAVPQFTAVTISTTTFSLWPVIMPPRGSPPAATGTEQQTGTFCATNYHLSGSAPVKPAIPNGKARYVHAFQNSRSKCSNTPQSNGKTFLGAISCPPPFS